LAATTRLATTVIALASVTEPAGPGKPGKSTAGPTTDPLRLRRHFTAVAAVMACFTIVAGSAWDARPAAADDVSQAQVRDLALNASHDPSALAKLRRVDAVDHRPVQLARALDTKDPGALKDRLAALAEESAQGHQGTSVDQPSPSNARVEANRILRGRGFRTHRTPGPFRGLLNWLGDRLTSLGRFFAPVGRFFSNTTTLVVVAVGAIVIAGVAATRLTRRRIKAATGGVDLGAGVLRSADPGQLEAEAAAAEEVGDLARALRLRFRAGLIRLQRMGFTVPASATTGQLRRSVPTPHFLPLAADFDEVVYGGRRAESADLEAARVGWRRVLETAKSR
jgi:hypothetical protein